MALQEQLRSKMATYERLRKEELAQCDGLFSKAIINLAQGNWVADAANRGESQRVILAKYINIPSYCLTTAVITKPQKPIEGVKVTTGTSFPLISEKDGEIPITFSW